MRLRPLALAVALPAVVAAAAAGVGLHAHFGTAPAATRPAATAVPATPAPQSPTSPPPRAGAALAWDPVHHVDVLFGGAGADRGALHDTWTWDGLAWQELHPPASPPAMERASAAWDPDRGRLVLIGMAGLDRSAPLPLMSDGDWQTWTWDGATWRRDVSATIASEGVLGTPQLVYDAAGRRMLAVAQVRDHSGTDTVRTHAWRDGGWTDADQTVLDTAAPVAVAWDSAAGAVRMLQAAGGRGAPVAVHQWTWSSTGWRAQPDASGFAGVQAGSLATSPFGRGLVQVDPAGVAGWDGHRWSVARPAAAPPALTGFSVAPDPDRHTVVLAGGQEASAHQLSGQTWTWDGRTWSSRGGGMAAQPTLAPPGPRNPGPCAMDTAPQETDTHIGAVLQITITLPPAPPECATRQIELGVVDDNGVPLAVQGNPIQLKTGATRFTVRWSNWCGGGATYFGIGIGSEESSASTVRPPACTASAQPSTLRLLATA